MYLVGSCNQSTLLATRTKKLIEEIQPDTVLVQAEPEWWQVAKSMPYVESQEEMNQYTDRLDRYLERPEKGYLYFAQRHWLSSLRLGLYLWTFKMHFGWDNSFRPEKPGLEVKYACEAAEKVGAKIEYMGSEIDSRTWKRLQHETRLNLLQYLYNRFVTNDQRWTYELWDNRIKF